MRDDDIGKAVIGIVGLIVLCGLVFWAMMGAAIREMEIAETYRGENAPSAHWQAPPRRGSGENDP